jgi:putative ATP-dependent endonuclease of OLD family
MSFARDNITPSRIPVNTSLIDSSSAKFRNGSDVYISRIIKTGLEAKEVIDISQAHRRLRDDFRQDNAIKVINKKIDETTTITDKKVELSVELLSKNAWETSLTTYLDEVPFRHIGKGEQCLVKTELAMKNSKSMKAHIILIEEPENHLSHSKLNNLLKKIKESNKDKQLIVSTHNSFVANKLGLSNIQILNNKKLLKLKDLSPDTRTFFEKIAGYDTLRLILCKKAILVEGDSDELIVQKAYMNKNDGKLPIEDEIDVISVGTSFLRFLEIAKAIEKPVNVVTDNDGNVDALEKKYNTYLNENEVDHISICYDKTVDEGDLEISGKPFNYNTLEPKILKANNLEKMNDNVDDLLVYMKKNKTECALKVFENADSKFDFPDYIMEGIE